MSDVELEYDKRADAIYVPMATTEWHHQVNLDDRRILDYDKDGRLIGIELLGVSNGIDVEGLPERTLLAKALTDLGIAILQPA